MTETGIVSFKLESQSLNSFFSCISNAICHTSSSCFSAPLFHYPYSNVRQIYFLVNVYLLLDLKLPSCLLLSVLISEMVEGYLEEVFNTFQENYNKTHVIMDQRGTRERH